MRFCSLQLLDIGSVILLAGVFSFVQQKSWYDNDWKHRRMITINNKANSSELIDYQVKVTLNSNNFDFAEAKTDGSDIRVTDTDGVTLIPYFIASYNLAGESATLWVKVPNIPASSEKTIYIYYGN